MNPVQILTIALAFAALGMALNANYYANEARRAAQGKRPRPLPWYVRLIDMMIP